MPRRFAIGSAQDLVQAERDIRARVGDSELDFAAMAAVSNIYRAANAIRNHMEQQVLAEEDLSWARSPCCSCCGSGATSRPGTWRPRPG
jgi:hypothetical protein